MYLLSHHKALLGHTQSINRSLVKIPSTKFHFRKPFPSKEADSPDKNQIILPTKYDNNFHIKEQIDVYLDKDSKDFTKPLLYIMSDLMNHQITGLSPVEFPIPGIREWDMGYNML